MEIVMDDLNAISQRDKVVIQDLLEQERIGEDAFAKYYKGDPSGAQQVKDVLRASAVNIRSLRNSSLRHQAKDLLTELNKVIDEYMKNPSNDNLGALKSGVGQYKNFLSQF